MQRKNHFISEAVDRMTIVWYLIDRQESPIDKGRNLNCLKMHIIV